MPQKFFNNNQNFSRGNTKNITTFLNRVRSIQYYVQSRVYISLYFTHSFVCKFINSEWKLNRNEKNKPHNNTHTQEYFVKYSNKILFTIFSILLTTDKNKINL